MFKPDVSPLCRSPHLFVWFGQGTAGNKQFTLSFKHASKSQAQTIQMGNVHLVKRPCALSSDTLLMFTPFLHSVASGSFVEQIIELQLSLEQQIHYKRDV